MPIDTTARSHEGAFGLPVTNTIATALLALAVTHSLIPDPAHDGWAVAVIALGISGVWVGARRHPGHTRSGWTLFATGLTGYGIGDVGFVVLGRLAGPDSAAAVGAKALGLLFLPTAIMGARHVLRSGRAQRDRESAYDAAIVTVTLTYICWVAFILPWVRLTDPVSVAGGTSFLFLLAVLCICGLVTARMMAGGSPGIWLFAAATVAAVVSTGTYRAFEHQFAWSSAPVSRPLMALAYVAMVLAANHPSFRPGLQHGSRPVTDSPVWRVWLLAAAVSIVVVVHVGGNAGLWPLTDPDLVGVATLLACIVLGARRVVIVWDSRDLALRQMQEREARHQQEALTDPLTDMPNRVALMQSLARATADSSGDGSIAVLFVDLDQFKVVNDSLGHPAGDEMIIEVATRIRDACGPDDFVARIGGDEFAVVTRSVGSAEDATTLAAHLNVVLAQPLSVRGHDVSASASIGIAINRDPGDTPMSLLRDADTAMYRAKADGRNGFALFDEAWGQHSADRLALEGELRRALANNVLELYYQPIVNLGTGELTGFEALLRWPDAADEGLSIDPYPQTEDLIEVAEASGLIIPLGEWVVRRACADLRRLKVALDLPDLRVGINVSGVQLRQPGFGDIVADAMSVNGMGRHHLVVELTESVVVEDSPTTRATLSALRTAGVPLAMDDFGTGYSALVNLKKFPFAIMKIDGGFVAGLPHDPEQTAIVRACVGIADALGLDIVAEGVENAEQVTALREAGCGYGQGYFLGRPMSVDSVIATRTSGRVGR